MRRSTLTAALFATLTAAAAGGYGAYWFHFAAGVRAGVERWAAEQRDRGYAVGYDSLEIAGFPGRLRLRAAAPTIARPPAEPLWRWAGPRLLAEVAPWRPRQAVITLPGAQRLTFLADGRRRTLTAEAAAARLELSLDHRGRVRRATLDATEIAAVVSETGETAYVERLDLVVSPQSPAEAAASERVDIALAVEQLVLPPQPDNPLGSEIRRLIAELAAHGPLPLDGTAAAARAWTDAGGRLDVGRVEVHWGSLRVEADGGLGLDDRLQPQGEFDTALRGWDGVFDALVAAGQMSRAEATLASLGLAALARPAADGGPAVLPAAVSLRDRRLYLGPVRLLKLRPLIWRAPAP
jgi:hypothetical protein